MNFLKTKWETTDLSKGSVVSDHALKEVLRQGMSKRKGMSITTLPEQCPASGGLCQSWFNANKSAGTDGVLISIKKSS